MDIVSSRQWADMCMYRYRDATGKSVENLEREKASKAVLESQNKAQVEYNCELQDELAQLRAQLAMSQTTNERQASKAADLERKNHDQEEQLQCAEQKLREGELLRRKLHNTILVSFSPLQYLLCIIVLCKFPVTLAHDRDFFASYFVSSSEI